MSALFHFSSLLTVILLLICTCAYIRSIWPSLLDRRKTGPLGTFWKFARIGERLSPYVAVFCIGMAFHTLFIQWSLIWSGLNRHFILSNQKMKSFYIFCAFISIISHHSGIESTLSQSDKKSKKDTVKVKKDTSREGPIAASVYSKGLVTTKLSSKNDILDHYGNYHQDTTFHNFDGTVLGKFISFFYYVFIGIYYFVLTSCRGKEIFHKVFLQQWPLPQDHNIRAIKWGLSSKIVPSTPHQTFSFFRWTPFKNHSTFLFPQPRKHLENFDVSYHQPRKTLNIWDQGISNMS